MPYPLLRAAAFPCTASFGPGGAPVYVLDLSPLYRRLPRAVRLGLDPRLSSWFGVPEAPTPPSRPLPSPAAPPSNQWRITSDATAMPPWEAALFGAVLNCSANLPLLQWRRVYALGHHVEWTQRGLRLMTPPPGTPYAVFPEEVKDSALEKDAKGNAFYDTAASNTVVNASGRAVFRYPLLAFRTDQSDPEGAIYGQGVNLGMTGRLGWLGASSIGIVQSAIGIVFMSEGLPTLEIMAVAAPAALEGIWNDSAAIQPGALERMDPAHAEALDEAVVFWGLWGDIDSQQGLSPPGLSGVGSVEVPLSQLGVPRLQDAVPNHPLVAWAASGGGEFPLTPALANDLEECGPGFMSGALAMAVRGWEALVETHSYGAATFSYDVALWEPGGFARWPGITEALAADIAADLSRETVLLIPGGCTRPASFMLQNMVCGYVDAPS